MTELEWEGSQYGPIRPHGVAITEGPTYIELMQALADALICWHDLIYHTHYPLLRNYEYADIYDGMSEILQSANRHDPSTLVLPLPACSPTVNYRIGDTKKPTYDSFRFVNSRRIPEDAIDEARWCASRASLRKWYRPPNIDWPIIEWRIR